MNQFGKQITNNVIKVRPRPHQSVFVENAYISMRLVLRSTLIRWASSSKTHRFSNALESGSKQKLIHIVLFWTGKGRNRIKMKTMTENI